ncbi:hypothetical protein BDF19DRAFT_424404 [Syncephalis fuscata]|nr:hypothetical protein BDF19DRAFT_424404 [Syncephalis fuscata]
MTELKAQAATAYRLEREETFREACALGNERVVQQMLRTGGIVVNGQNRVNGWTALHWATARGHTSIIELLLAYNADPSVAATDGRLPLDLTKDDAIKALLSTTLNGSLLPSQSNTNEPLLFTPHYLEQPDLGRVWATPEEFEPALPRTTTLIATANQNISNTDTNNENSSSISNASNTSLPRELIVYKEEASPDNMWGPFK